MSVSRRTSYWVELKASTSAEFGLALSGSAYVLNRAPRRFACSRSHSNTDWPFWMKNGNFSPVYEQTQFSLRMSLGI